jgi:hypothetical protein
MRDVALSLRRAVMSVVQAATVGALPMIPSVQLDCCQAAILAPSDLPFARDGILTEEREPGDDGDWRTEPRHDLAIAGDGGGAPAAG